MNQSRELGEKERSAIQSSIKNSFGSTLITALSVIQGVALAELGAVIVADFQHFAPTDSTLIHSLQAVATFFILIGVWDTITKDSLIWKWIPGFQESLIPFVLGVVELYLSYSTTLTTSFWLIGVAIIAFLRGVGYIHVLMRGRDEEETNTLLNQVRSHFMVAIVYSGIGTLLFVGLAILNGTGALAAALVALVIVLIWIAGTFISAHLYWQKLIKYIQFQK